jgi:phosphatidylglycerol---prolipoprotein diacylglyceryl transferase
MIPEIFTLGPIPINSFGLMIALALIVGVQRLTKSFELRGIEPEKADRYVMFAGISGLVGARLWHVATNLEIYGNDLVSALFSGAGFTFYGGFIVATVVLILLARRDGISLWTLADATAPTLALGYAIGRLGCQLSGDGDYGIATDSLWGMSFAQGVVPTPPGVLVYPTPLYESVLSIFVLWVVTKFENRLENVRVGTIFSIYLFLISIERFMIEFIRQEPRYSSGLSEAQYVAAVLLAISVILYVFRPKVSGEDSL